MQDQEDDGSWTFLCDATEAVANGGLGLQREQECTSQRLHLQHTRGVVRRSPCTNATRYHRTPNRNHVPVKVRVKRKNFHRHCISRNVVQRSRMYKADRPLMCSMRTLLRPSLDRTRLRLLKVPPPPGLPAPNRGFRTSVCVCE